MTITKQLVQKVMETPIINDESVLVIATQGIVDYFACILQAKDAPEIKQLKQWSVCEGGHFTSWLIGQKQGATARQAALFNGFQAHLLDYDDVHEEVRGHPSAVILSALFASIDCQQKVDKSMFINGKRFLTAYILGIEIMARLGAVLNPHHYNQGFHTTGTLGGIAAVTAICYLHQYDFLEQALALAATQSSGLRIMFGTPIKPLHAGFAAQSAIQTIEILKVGLTAQVDFLNSHNGFLSVYGNKGMKLLLDNWGKSWKISEPGLWFKTYSFCSAAATIADSAKKLSLFLTVDQIDKIELQFNFKGDAALIYKSPKTKAQGRFSAEYIVAKIFLREALDLNTFTDTSVPYHVQEIIQKMSRTYGEDTQRFGGVKVWLKTGEIIEHKTEYPKGSPKNPYSSAELYEKLAGAMQNPLLSQQFFEDIQKLKYGLSLYHFIHQYKDTL